MPQVMGEHFRLSYLRFLTELLHAMENIAAVHRFPAPGDKHTAGGDPSLPYIKLELIAKFKRKDHRACFPLKGHLRPSAAEGGYRDE